MTTRDDLLKIIGYGAEVSEPDGKPIFGFYLDRHLRPILDQLVEYVDTVRADERERSTPVFVASVPVIVAMADLRAEVQVMKDEAEHALLYAETHDEVTAASVGISVLDDVLTLLDGRDGDE